MPPEETRRAAIDWTNRGAQLAGQRRFREAADCFRQAITADSTFALAQKNLAICLGLLGDFRGAITAYQSLLEAEPNNAETHSKLGDLHVMLGQFEPAAERYQTAILLNLNDVRIHQNLASSLGELGRYNEAIEPYRRAIGLAPDRAELHRGLGIALQAAGRIDDALLHFNRSLELNPGEPEPRMRRAMCLLMKGDYEQGWLDYEARKDLGYLRYRHIEPRWEGEPLDRRTLLVETEQGLGDTIQFVRYLAQIKQRHTGRVVLACEPQLIPLLTGIAGADLLVSQDQPRPPFDCWIPLMSVARIFGPAPLPTQKPYLSAAPDRVARWRSRLASIPGRKIGIAWQGSPMYPGDRQRSIPLAHFLRLQDIPNVTLISLQKGFGAEQLATHPNHRIITFDDDFDSDGAFLDTAAILQNLDLLISSDTSIPHLAAALAVPTWLALPHVPHWRWQLHGDRMPWYSTMRLFRQTSRGDWSEVFDRIARELSTP